MRQTYQVYNKKIGAWVKVREDGCGKTKIIDVKQREPKIKFKGVKVKK